MFFLYHSIQCTVSSFSSGSPREFIHHLWIVGVFCLGKEGFLAICHVSVSEGTVDGLEIRPTS